MGKTSGLGTMQQGKWIDQPNGPDNVAINTDRPISSCAL